MTSWQQRERAIKRKLKIGTMTKVNKPKPKTFYSICSESKKDYYASGFIQLVDQRDRSKVLVLIPPGAIVYYVGPLSGFTSIYSVVGYQEYFGLVVNGHVSFYELPNDETNP